MIEFATKLEERLNSILVPIVGVGSDPTFYVKTWDDHLHDEAVENMPFIVITTRTAEKSGESEIGSKYDLTMYTVHIYYLDIDASHSVGKKRRSNILSRVRKVLMEDRRLGNLLVTELATQTTEYVYDTTISAVLFDESGQEEYYTFISELYLNVYTAAN